MSLISEMDNDTYEAVKACICPYCAAKIPTTLIAGYRQEDNRWTHAIPGTSDRFNCLAERFRNARRDPSDTTDTVNA